MTTILASGFRVPSVCAARVHTNRRGAKTANSSSLARGTPQGISKDCVRFSRGSQKQFSRDMQQRGVRTRAIVEPAGKNGIATDRKVATNVSPVDALSSPIVPNAPPKDKTFVAKVCFIGPDKKGLMAGLTQLMFGCGCNILSSAQYVSEDGIFFQRMSIDFSGAYSGKENREALESSIENMAKQYNMISWKIDYAADPHKVGILVSKIDHCLWDLLVRHANKELKCDIPFIISNHPDLGYIAEQFKIPFEYLPMEVDKFDGDKKLAKADQEAKIEAVIEKYGADTLVMARYMQVLSDSFCEKHASHTINIHHSFLPAFEGAKPYHRAKERGVKLIGATAHYATAKLDMGPIIVQDVAPVSHRDTVQDMVRKGKDLERVALARALRSHLESRVLVHQNRTVVFD